MSVSTFPNPIITGTDFVFHARVTDDAGDLLDLSTADVVFIGRKDVTDRNELFQYDQNSSEIELEVFPASPLIGLSEDQNMRVTIPSDVTLAFRDSGLGTIRVGLLVTPPGSSPLQILANSQINICSTVAPSYV